MRAPEPPLTRDQQELAASHYLAALHFCKKYRSAYRDLDWQDYRQTILLALCQAARSWDGQKGAFTTHLGWLARGALIQARRDERPAGYKNTQRYREYPRTSDLGDRAYRVTLSRARAHHAARPAVWEALAS